MVATTTAEERDRALAMAVAEQELAQEQVIMQQQAVMQHQQQWGPPGTIAQGVVVEPTAEYQAAAALVRQYSSPIAQGSHH